MNVPRHRSPNADADLETTAELPMLDVAAYEARTTQDRFSSTDTWVAPPPGDATQPPADAAYREQRARLEDELKSAATGLRDAERRLALQEEQLRQSERDLQSALQARTEAEQREQALSKRLADAQAMLAAAEARALELQTMIGVRHAAESARRAHDGGLETELAQHKQALECAQKQLEALRLRVASHVELLQSLETRRGFFDVLLREKDAEASEREARLAQLERELARRTGDSAEMASELADKTAQLERLQYETSRLGAALARRADEVGALELANADLRRQIAALTPAACADGMRDREVSDVGEPAAPQEERRQAADTADYSPEEREPLIRRLQSEPTISALLLDQLESLARATAPSAGAQEIVPEGAARLLVRSDGNGEIVHVLGRKTSIGRTPDNDVQVDTKFVSRHHAVILAGPAYTIIEDLNSTNGVLVNNRRVTRQALKDGDIVAIGKAQFRFAVRPPPERR